MRDMRELIGDMREQTRVIEDRSLERQMGQLHPEQTLQCIHTSQVGLNDNIVHSGQDELNLACICKHNFFSLYSSNEIARKATHPSHTSDGRTPVLQGFD